MSARNCIQLAPEHERDFHRRQTARAAGECGLAGDGIQPDRFPIALQRNSSLQKLLLSRDIGAGGVSGRSNIELPNLLKSGNFSHIEQIADLNVSLADSDLSVMVDAEIFHGMSEGGRHAHQQHQNRSRQAIAHMLAHLLRD